MLILFLPWSFSRLRILDLYRRESFVKPARLFIKSNEGTLDGDRVQTSRRSIDVVPAYICLCGHVYDGASCVNRRTLGAPPSSRVRRREGGIIVLEACVHSL